MARSGCVALVLGIARYEKLPPSHQCLPSGIQDARKVAHHLRQCGWLVTQPAELDGTQLASAINEFTQLCCTAEASFFYFSGHGIQFEDNKHYLLANDFEGETREQLNKRDWNKHLYNTAYSVQDLQELLAEGQCPLNILVLDCCREVVKHSKSPLVRDWERIKVPAAGVAFLICYAVNSGQLALTGLEGKLSPFTQHVVQELFEAPVKRNVFDALTEAHERTLQQLGNQHQPMFELTSPKPFQGFCIDLQLAPDGRAATALEASPSSAAIAFPEGLSTALVHFWLDFFPGKPATSWQRFVTILQGDDRLSGTVRACEDAVVAEARRCDATVGESMFVTTALKPLLLLDDDARLSPENLLMLQIKLATNGHNTGGPVGSGSDAWCDCMNGMLRAALEVFDYSVLQAEVKQKLLDIAATLQVEGLAEEYGLTALQDQCRPGSRAWLMARVDEWLALPVDGANRLFVLLGGPGMGKSTFGAMLTQQRPAAIVAQHLFQVSSARCQSVRHMLLSLALQLAARWHSARRELERRLAALREKNCKPAALQATELVESLLAPMVRAVDPCEVCECGHVVLLDALDEAEVEGVRPPVITALECCLMQLPAWLRFLVTTRPELAAWLKGWQATVIEPGAKDNQDDLRAVVHARLAASSLLAPGVSLEQASQTILDKSQGVFLYAHYVFKEMLCHPGKGRGSWTLPDLQLHLPSGIHAIFEAILDRAQAALQRHGRLRHLGGPLRGVLLPVLAAMRAPLSLEELAWATGLRQEEEVQPMMRQLASLFPLSSVDSADSPPRAHPYHKAVTDMLLAEPAPVAGGTDEQDEDEDEDEAIIAPSALSVAAQAGSSSSSRHARHSRWAVDPQAGHRLFVAAALPELTDSITMQHWQQPCAPQLPHARYVLPHAVLHMAAAAAWHDLHAVLCQRLPALKALAEGRQVQPLLQQLAGVLQDPAAREALGAAAMSELGSVAAFLRYNQQALQADPHHLLQEAWNSPSSWCVHAAARALRPAADRSFWRGAVRMTNPPAACAAPLAVLHGHHRRVNACALRADGRMLVSGGAGADLRVWDLVGMECVGVLTHHPMTPNFMSLDPVLSDPTSGVPDQLFIAEVNTCALGCDGRRMVSGCLDHTLRVWDLVEQKCVAVLRGHTSMVSTCALSADGSTLVSGSADCTLRVWDLSTPDPECVAVLEGHVDWVCTCALSVDSRLLVSGSGDATLRVWELPGTWSRPSDQSIASLSSVAVLQGHGRGVQVCALSSDGCTLVSGSQDTTLRVWDLASRACVAVLEGHQQVITCCALAGTCSPHSGTSRTTLVSGSMDGILRVWDLTHVPAVQCVAVLQNYARVLHCCALSADAGTLVFSDDNALHVWDLSNFQGSSSSSTRAVGSDSLWLDSPHTFTCALSANGRMLAVSRARTDILHVWDLHNDKPSGTSLQGHTRHVTCAAWPADGHLLVSGSEDRTLRLWDMRTEGCVAVLKGHQGSVYACAISSNGRLLVSGSRDATLRVWDVSDTAATACMGVLRGHGQAVVQCALSADAAVLVSGSDDSVRVWDVHQMLCTRVLAVQMYRCEFDAPSCVLSANGSIMVSNFPHDELCVWDVVAWKQVGVLEGCIASVHPCSLTPDGRTLVCSDDDHTLQVWDIPSLQCVGELRVHDARIAASMVSADGRLLVSVSDDGTVRLWDMAGLRLGRVDVEGCSTDGQASAAHDPQQGVEQRGTCRQHSVAQLASHAGGYCPSPAPGAAAVESGAAPSMHMHHMTGAATAGTASQDPGRVAAGDLTEWCLLPESLVHRLAKQVGVARFELVG